MATIPSSKREVANGRSFRRLPQNLMRWFFLTTPCLVLFSMLPSAVATGIGATSASTTDEKSAEQVIDKEIAVSELLGTTRVVTSIADLHGDLDAAIEALKMSKLVREKPANAIRGSTSLGKADKIEWTGGAATLIQTGDIVDRGNESREIYELFFRLQDEAAKVGGEVILLLGNHEALRMQGDQRYRGPQETSWANGSDKDVLGNTAWNVGGWFRKELEKRTRTFAVVAGSLYVHGALVMNYARKLESIAQTLFDSTANFQTPLSTEVRLKTLAEYHQRTLKALGSGDIGNELVNDYSPFWSREYDLECEESVRGIFHFLGVQRVISGHTPQASGRIGIGCEKRLILADTAMSKAYRTAFPAGRTSFLTVETLEEDEQLRRGRGGWGGSGSAGVGAEPKVVKGTVEGVRQQKGAAVSVRVNGKKYHQQVRAHYADKVLELTDDEIAADAVAMWPSVKAKGKTAADENSNAAGAPTRRPGGATTRWQEGATKAGEAAGSSGGLFGAVGNFFSQLLTSNPVGASSAGGGSSSGTSLLRALLLLTVLLVMLLVCRAWPGRRGIGAGICSSCYYMWKTRTPRLVV
mmetsp:Transcript_17440/g.43415  ORF Transcript_17440/g.43415 Transcript_17440/m.43415 type:complete len:582 (-) Transcript_17440:350-2095(-)